MGAWEAQGRILGHGRISLSCGTCALILLAAVLGRGTARAEPTYARDGELNQDTVIELARNLARSPFAAPKAELPATLQSLDYDQYRDIRFRPEEAIWAKDAGSFFRVQLLSRGWLFEDPVEIAIVTDGKARHLAYRPELFTTGKVMQAHLPEGDIGFSGLRALFPINHPTVFDEIAVFQGASYFRSLGRNQGYGLSARGLAIKTGDPGGEEFPAFRAFWLDRPTRGGQALVVHALLDSPSATGAYRFTIRPGFATVMEVDVVLFPRTKIDEIGLAPASSMFMFSANGRHEVDDYRPQVHDSDGLLIINGNDEHLWRPLANPKELQMSMFEDRSPKGFGLTQRDRDPADYQDFEAHYERRPSLWVEPKSDFGQGAVVLTEIPTDAEIHDNIVAFWRPHAPIAADSEYRYSYRLYWNEGPKAEHDFARVLATRRGRADPLAPTPVRRFVIDFAKAPGKARSGHALPTATVTASAGAIKDIVVYENALTQGYRVSFTLDPKQAKLCELRAELVFKDERRAETWVYRWTKP